MQVLKEISVYYFANATPKHTTTALSERLWCKISPKANKSILGGGINLRIVHDPPQQ